MEKPFRPDIWPVIANINSRLTAGKALLKPNNDGQAWWVKAQQAEAEIAFAQKKLGDLMVKQLSESTAQQILSRIGATIELSEAEDFEPRDIIDMLRGIEDDFREQMPIQQSRAEDGADKLEDLWNRMQHEGRTHPVALGEIEQIIGFLRDTNNENDFRPDPGESAKEILENLLGDVIAGNSDMLLVSEALEAALNRMS